MKKLQALIITTCYLCVLLIPQTLFAADTSTPWHKRVFSKSTASSINSDRNLWEHVARNINLHTHRTNPYVKQHYNWYARNTNYLYRVLDRADPYLYHIVQELEARNLPLALALIPVVESAYDPFAFSHGGASGLWQFMPATANHFGIQQNWWYDGRRDIYDSTRAAAEYFAYLERFFDGDWLLVLAAYNAGEGTVQKAIRRNQRAGKRTDFWSLTLPRETQQYVPKILALAEIVARPHKIDLTLPYIGSTPSYDWVEIGHQLDLSVAANIANISLSELYKVNPGYNHWATPPDGPHRLLLPKESIQPFQTALAELPDEDKVNWTRYTIQQGDSLSTIANHHQTTVHAIQSLNNLDSHKIKAGTALLIPTSNLATADYTIDFKTLNLPAFYYSEQEILYTVKSGDSLWKIAKAYRVKINDILRWNNLASTQYLRPGQKIKIISNLPSETSSKQRPEITRKITYRVRRGDSIGKIASRFRVNTNELKQWNGLSESHVLQPGENLIVYVDVTKQSA